MKRWLAIVCVMLLLCALQTPAPGADGVILETVEGGPTTVIGGNARLANQKFSPASTIKMVIAWAGLESGIIGSQTVWLCNDSFLKGAPRGLNLHQALVLSSNVYFEKIAVALGGKRVDELVGKSGFFAGGPSRNWLAKGGVGAAAHGGTALISPQEEHQFMLRLMNGEIGSNERLRAELTAALEWPSPDPAVHLYGKTGSSGKVLWFNGFGVKDGRRKAVTVFQKGSVQKRPQVIAAFYARWGLIWNEALLDTPGFFQQ